MLLIDKLGADGFSEEDERTLSLQAAQAGRIYENGSLYARVQQQVQQLQAQAAERERAEVLLRLEHAVARALASADDMSAGVEAVLRIVCESQQWEFARFWRADDAGGVLRMTAQWSAPGMPSGDSTKPRRCACYARAKAWREESGNRPSRSGWPTSATIHARCKKATRPPVVAAA